MPDRGAALTAGAALAGGVLYFLGYVGYGVWPCLLVFLCPLWWALERVRTERVAAAAGVGLLFGLAAYAGGFVWLWRLVDVFLGGNVVAGAVLWTAYGAWFAAGFAVYALLFRAVRAAGRSVALAGVPPLLLIEWLQPQLFPVHAGAGLVYLPAWIQVADLGGPLLLSALVGIANVLAFETARWLAGARPRAAAVWAAGLALAGLVWAYGRARVVEVDAAVARAPALRVGLVQANLGLLEKRVLSEITHRRHLEQTRELLGDGPVDLVVWPETAYVRGLRRPLPISGQPILAELAVPLLFGGSSVREEDGRRVKSNSAFLIGADRVIRDVYDKNLLIPLAEHVPLVGAVPAVARWLPHVQEFGAATDAPALRLGPWRLATPICYEAVRADFVRRMVRQSRPHLLVTLANDAWFGDSQEPWLHLALARLRAVEHRRYLVRSTNSGVSAVVDPAGRIVARSGLLTRENLRAVVHPLEGDTVYARLGDWPGWLAAALVACAVLVRGRRAPATPAAYASGPKNVSRSTSSSASASR